jgi:hypothetical protein
MIGAAPARRRTSRRCRRRDRAAPERRRQAVKARVERSSRMTQPAASRVSAIVPDPAAAHDDSLRSLGWARAPPTVHAAFFRRDGPLIAKSPPNRLRHGRPRMSRSASRFACLSTRAAPTSRAWSRTVSQPPASRFGGGSAMSRTRGSPPERPRRRRAAASSRSRRRGRDELPRRARAYRRQADDCHPWFHCQAPVRRDGRWGGARPTVFDSRGRRERRGRAPDLAVTIPLAARRVAGSVLAPIRHVGDDGHRPAHERAALRRRAAWLEQPIPPVAARTWGGRRSHRRLLSGGQAWSSTPRYAIAGPTSARNGD